MVSQRCPAHRPLLTPTHAASHTCRAARPSRAIAPGRALPATVGYPSGLQGARQSLGQRGASIRTCSADLARAGCRAPRFAPPLPLSLPTAPHAPPPPRIRGSARAVPRELANLRHSVLARLSRRSATSSWRCGRDALGTPARQQVGEGSREAGLPAMPACPADLGCVPHGFALLRGSRPPLKSRSWTREVAGGREPRARAPAARRRTKSGPWPGPAQALKTRAAAAPPLTRDSLPHPRAQA